MTVCGVDEAGRGAWAGPVVAAAVILDIDVSERMAAHHLRDSKVMTAEEREKAYAWLMGRCVYGVGLAHHRMVDELNVYQATLKIMRRAIAQLGAQVPNLPETIIVDAMPLSIPENEGRVIYFPFAESRSRNVAAASIIAKVVRDRIMARLDPLFPGYGWLDNKAYGTPAHQEALARQGITYMHRMTYIDHRPEVVSQQMHICGI